MFEDLEGSAPAPERTHITALVTDIVEFSSRQDVEQIRTVIDFQRAVESLLDDYTPLLRDLGTEGKSPFRTDLIPTGDGLLIVLDHGRSDLPTRRAYAQGVLDMTLELLRRLEGKPYQIRAALSEGPAFRYTDLNGQVNYAGATLNLAYRVMNLGDGGHVLVGDPVHRLLRRGGTGTDPGLQVPGKFLEYRNIFIKHDVRITVHQFAGDAPANLNRQVPRNVVRQLRNVDTHAMSWTVSPDVLRGLGVIAPGCNQLRYADNLFRHSDKLIILLSGLGLDHHDFTQQISVLDYHCVAVSLYGFHPDDEEYPSIPIAKHCEILGRFIRDQVRDLQPAQTVLVGFSLGGDIFARMLMDCILTEQDVNALVTLDCNLGPHTCFLSRRLARLRPGDDLTAFILETNREIIDQGESFSAWLRLQKYFIDVFGKGRGNTRLLADLARQVLDDFGEVTTTSRMGALRDLSRVMKVRCIFSDNADNDIGAQPSDDAFQAYILKGLNHFDLYRTSVLRRVLHELLGE
ncbi:MAG: hypothetical protein KA419_12105 [Acidobacteria bacterium]|nr:hypothetical protein [Acidobacteriota bacterium]